MENPPDTHNASNKRFPDITIGEMFITPFQPVEVLRALGPYGRMLDLEPAISKTPDPEFLVWLLTGHASHQACIRHVAGGQYKNLENLIRGRHKVSSTTKLLLVNALGLSMEDLEKLSCSAPDGPLLPEILTLFQIVEGLPMRVTTGLLDREVPCPCCGKNLLDNVDVWWQKQTPGMRPAEYHLAERLLNAVLGAGLIGRFVAFFQERADLSLERLAALANPSRHPIGNWLSEAQEAMSCDSLAELAAAMQLRGDVDSTFSHGRLKKWSSGQDVMPLEAAEAISKVCGQTKSGMRRLIAARTIALVTDFLAASLPYEANTVGRKVAREVVYARLEHLSGNLQIAIAAITGKIPQCFLAPGQIVTTPR
jgi:hypothetical protein